MARGDRQLSCEQCHHMKVKCEFEDSSACIRCHSRGTRCVQRTTRASKARPKRKSVGGKAATGPIFHLVENPGLDLWAAEQGKCKNVPDDTISADAALDRPAYDTITPGLDFGSLTAADFFSADLALASQDESFTTGTPSTICDDKTSCPCLAALREVLGTMQPPWDEWCGLDGILQRNREAVSALNGVHGCARAHEAPVGCLALLVAQRVLGRYGTALEWCPGGVAGKRAEVRIGSYSVCSADEPAVRRQVVLFELHRMELLLQRLALQDHGCGQNEETSSIRTLMHGSLCWELEGLVRKACMAG